MGYDVKRFVQEVDPSLFCDICLQSDLNTNRALSEVKRNGQS